MKKCAILMCVLLIWGTAFFAFPAEKQQTKVRYYATEFNGATDFTESTFTVTHTNRVYVGNNIAPMFPSYLPVGVTCVPIAASNILGFYDRFYPNLIPNFTPGITYGNYYLYIYEDDNVSAAAFQVATAMGITDFAHGGATVNQFKTGMTTYCSNLSFNISFSRCMQYGAFNYNEVKTQLLSGKPVIIFCSAFNLAVNTSDENSDTTLLYSSSDAHAMVVFGYTEITYTLPNGTTRVDNYLRVATGLSLMRDALVYLGTNVTIDDAYAVNIY